MGPKKAHMARLMRGSWRVPLAGHWVGTMRCMACGAEMILLKVIADETMPVPGFQRHAYMCSLCHDTEQRLFFNKHAQQRELETVPAPVEPASTVLNLRAAAKGFLEPVLAKLPRVRSAQ
jgi:hypothetical protein